MVCRRESLEIEPLDEGLCDSEERTRLDDASRAERGRELSQRGDRRLRCALLRQRFTLDAVRADASCPFAGSELRIGVDLDEDGAVSATEAERTLRFCSAHADLPALPVFSAPFSGAAARLRLPLVVGLDLDGDGSLRSSELFESGELDFVPPSDGPLVQQRWLAPCQKHKWGGSSAYRRCRETSTNVVAVERVTDLSRIGDGDELSAVREELSSFVFGPSGLPTRLPDAVTFTLEDVRWYDELSALDDVERLEIVLGPDLRSIAYLFFPTTANGELFLYHEGHDGDFWRGRATIGALLERGYAVLAFAMPLRGHNPRPGSGDGWWNHRHLWRRTPDEGTALRYFLEPIVVGVNHALSTHGFARVHAIGISGGGWSLTFAAALDERIATTFAVAGSLPHFARATSGPEWGDREQNWRPLYQRASYLDAYLLGSLPEGRRFFQIANEDDSCCFKGPRHAGYTADVASFAAERGGSFRFWMDEDQGPHGISDDTRAFVIGSLSASLPPLDEREGDALSP